MARPGVNINRSSSDARKQQAEKKKIHAEKQRERRRKIKEDPVKCAVQKEKEKQRYLKKKERKVVKPIAEKTIREQRHQRKRWRINIQNHRKNKAEARQTEENTAQFLMNNTPPGSPTHNVAVAVNIAVVHPNPEPAVAGPSTNNDSFFASKLQKSETTRRKNAYLFKKRFRAQENAIKLLKIKMETYKKKLHRRQKNDLKLVEKPSPNTRVQTLCSSNPCSSSPEVVRRLLFGEAVFEQLTENYKTKNPLDMNIIRKTLTGPIMRKNKLLSYSTSILKKWHKQPKKYDPSCLREYQMRKNQIQLFLEQDNCSRMCAGKKEFVVQNKQTHQKRFLSNSLKFLHKAFLVQHPNIPVSYTFFCKNRPFWIKELKVSERNTCQCIKHANMELLVQSLHKYKILKEGSAYNAVQVITCLPLTVKCLFRSCEHCYDKEIHFLEFDSAAKGEYSKWVATKQKYLHPKDGTEKITSKMSKNLNIVPLKDIVQEFKVNLTTFLQHQGRILHQYLEIHDLKTNLRSHECLIHMDFSENYALKYGEETQSFHFGGSRKQISLHTVVAYTNVFDSIIPKSYCTISESLAHGPSAIWCHLQPVLSDLPTDVDTLHFLSDGPATQYKNKTMFYILANKLKLLYPKMAKFTWNYLEAGHGKGAADGVGAVCKRTADRTVAQGKDVADFNTFFCVLKENCPKINIFKIFEEKIKEFETTMLKANIKTFLGTMKVHQVSLSISQFHLLLKH